MQGTLTFEQFLVSTAENGEAVNLMFEQRLFDLVSILHRITGPLRQANLPHELVGGLAVLVHVEEADPTHAVMTRGVDLMIERPALENLIAIAQENGFRFRHAASVDILLYGPEDKAVNAVRLLSAGEKVKPAQETSNPEIAPVEKVMHGRPIAVISVPDLLRMKLSANRDKDRVHIRSMDAAGLIDDAIAHPFSPELAAPLKNIRQTE